MFDLLEHMLVHRLELPVLFLDRLCRFVSFASSRDDECVCIKQVRYALVCLKVALALYID